MGSFRIRPRFSKRVNQALKKLVLRQFERELSRLYVDPAAEKYNVDAVTGEKMKPAGALT